MKLISWLWSPLWLPHWLFLIWRRRIFLRSTGWRWTRERIFRQQGRYCKKCGRKSQLEIHHIDHSGQPKPRLWHFIPLARFVMFAQDYSKLIVLCNYDHMQETIKERQK